jgi:hypothetical protein
MKRFLFLLLSLLVVSVSLAATPSALSDGLFSGVVGQIPTTLDTITSATDSATVLSDFVVPKDFKGCSFVLVQPAMTGGGSDSVKAIIRIKQYTSSGTYLGTYTTTDTMSTSTSYRFILPIETTRCPASKYTVQFIGYTGSGGVVIFPAGVIYAIKSF